MLFSDMLIITSLERRNKTFDVKQAFDMYRARVVDIADFATVRHALQIIHPQASLLLSTTSNSQKTLWLNALTAVMLRFNMMRLFY